VSSKGIGLRFFVSALSPADPEKLEGFLYEIQILDSHGRGEQAGYLREGDDHLEIEGYVIPRAVIDAARRQREGQGDYVDSEGRTIQPF
jgi:hypothetical protein